MANDDPAIIEADSLDQAAPAAKKSKLVADPDNNSNANASDLKNDDEAIIDYNDEQFNEALDQIKSFESQLETIEEEQSNKIIELEQKYVKIKTPIYDQRSKVIAKIPNFWSTCLLNHPQLSSMMSEEDQKVVFKYLKNISVDHTLKDIKFKNEIDGKEYVKSLNCAITFEWDSDNNPYFSNASLTKSYYQLMENVISECETIEWKPEMNLIEKCQKQFQNDAAKNENNDEELEGESFFNWFEDNSNDEEIGCDDIAEIIKEEIWPNALNYFLGNVDDEDEAGDSEDITA